MKDKNLEREKSRSISKDDLSNAEDESGDEGVRFLLNILLNGYICYLELKSLHVQHHLKDWNN